MATPNIYNDDTYTVAALWVWRSDNDGKGDVTTSHLQRANVYNNRCYVWDGTYQSAITQTDQLSCKIHKF